MPVRALRHDDMLALRGGIRMTRSKVAAAALLAASASVVLLAQGPRRDGQWDVVVDMQMAGMQMPPMKTTQCITKQQAADPQKSLPNAVPGNDCKVSDYKIDGNKATWSMKCTGKQPMTGSGEIVYADNAYTGSMKVDSEGQTMTMKYSAKRTGDCNK